MVQENCLKKVIVICGPTGSGKSDLAIKIAQKLNTEIVSADSIAIYKELNVGTAKPSQSEQKMAVHHMIDVCDATENFTVTDYSLMATKCLNAIFEKGKIPVICGGTGFYINSILFDFSYGNCSKNDAVRKKYESLLKEQGKEALFAILQKVDPETAQKLHPNDTMRVIRALEIFDCSGVKKSSQNDNFKPKYKIFAYSYDYPRDVLYNRINLRVDKMFSGGLVAEVKGLIANGLSLDNQSMQGIGYKEFLQFDNIDDNIEEIKELIKLNSRRYAKRQITFFKKLCGLKYITEFDAELASRIICEEIEDEID